MAVDEKEHKGHRERGEKRDHKVQESKDEHWRSAFPPNITVDELWLYRKRKPNVARLGDNLKIEEGSFKYLKTEYTRRFKNFYETLKSLNEDQKESLRTSLTRPQSTLKLEGTHDFQSNYNESFRKQLIESLSEPIHEIIDKKHVENETTGRLSTSLQLLGGLQKYSRRRRLHKRPTNLEIQGSYSHITEHAEQFIEYLLAERAKLCRTPTNLKLEGDMETKTETGSQFIDFNKVERRPLCKKFTELHLEGDLDIRTEKQEKFVPFEIPKRPPLVKKSTNLHLEGDHFLVPEYRHQYVFYNSSERPKLILPLNNLKTGGMFEDEAADKGNDRNIHPLIPFLRDSDGKHDDSDSKRRRHQSTSSHFGYGFLENASQGTGLTRVSSHPNLGRTQAIGDDTVKGKRLYQHNAYIDFDTDKKPPTSRRRSRKDGSGLSYMKGDSVTDAKPEYSRAFVDFPRQRPSLRRPIGHLTSDGEREENGFRRKENIFSSNSSGEKYNEISFASSASSSGRSSSLKLIFERQKLLERGQYTTEKTDQFVSHGTVEKTGPCKRKSELKMEGRFECQPEYRKAYVDYLIREKKPPIVTVTRAVEETDTHGMSDPSPSENLSSSETGDKIPLIAQEKKPKVNRKVLSSPSRVSSSSSAVPSSPAIKPSSSKISKKFYPNKIYAAEGTDLGFDQSVAQQKKASPRRSLTPSPRVQPRGGGRHNRKEMSQNYPNSIVKGSWRASGMKRSISSDTDGWHSSSETDPAFFILDDGLRRTSFRDNLYKEQKWMPSWYSVQ